MVLGKTLTTRLFFVLIIMGTAGCNVADPGSSSSSSTTSTASPFWISVSTTWQSSSITETQGTCSIPAGSAAGTVILGTACTIAVPESQLLLSDLDITVGLDDPDDCATVSYQPYYYKASVGAAFDPYWATGPIDCSVSPAPSDCFQGAAADVLGGDFDPDGGYSGVWTTGASIGESDNTWETKTLESANSQTIFHNRKYSNSVHAGSDTTQVLADDGYIAASVVNYSFTCRDEYGDDIYAIEIYIDDDDGTDGDDWDDWANY